LLHARETRSASFATDALLAQHNTTYTLLGDVLKSYMASNTTILQCHEALSLSACCLHCHPDFCVRRAALGKIGHSIMAAGHTLAPKPGFAQFFFLTIQLIV
jgi:hypothetical protein